MATSSHRKSGRESDLSFGLGFRGSKPSADERAAGGVSRTRGPVALGIVQKQFRSLALISRSVERQSVERGAAFEAGTPYALTLHALTLALNHNVRIAPETWKLLLRTR